jgi:hypothetical protein
MARPRKIPGERSVQASFSLSDVEYEAIKELARQQGQTTSEWLRGTAVARLSDDPLYVGPNSTAGAAIPSPTTDT